MQYFCDNNDLSRPKALFLISLTETCHLPGNRVLVVDQTGMIGMDMSSMLLQVSVGKMLNYFNAYIQGGY